MVEVMFHDRDQMSKPQRDPAIGHNTFFWVALIDFYFVTCFCRTFM